MEEGCCLWICCIATGFLAMFHLFYICDDVFGEYDDDDDDDLEERKDTKEDVLTTPAVEGYTKYRDQECKGSPGV